ncbi:hypothetical protein ACFE04_017483 [Oxalis oulophora]
MKKKNQTHCTISFFFILVILCISSSSTTSAATTTFDYGDALSKSLLYFEAQRSGRLPYNQRVKWRDHSGLTDGLEQGVKFDHALEAIKWGTDYFIKAHTSPNVLWAEVGDGDTDHYCWQRSEDMTTSRQAYRVDENNPGSDLAGETAAAMAASSIVGKYDEGLGVVKSYYASVSGYKDELLWAALWLYKATDNMDYLNYVIKNANDFGGIGWAITEFSWDVKYAGLQILVSKLLIEKPKKEHKDILKQYQSKAEYYICANLNKNKNNDNNNNVVHTPGGMIFIRQWNNMQYVSTASFLLTVYSDFLKMSNQTLNCPSDNNGSSLINHEEILTFAKSQVDYILGSNPQNMSYLVGYGPKYPTRVHHRGASIESYRENKGFIGCTQGYDNWYGRVDPNPNVLVGAVVGGPDWQDRFFDQRGNYMQTEACTYNTAPLVGIFAKFLQLEEQKSVYDQDFNLVASYKK